MNMKEMMHNLLGTTTGIANSNMALNQASITQGILSAQRSHDSERHSKSKRIFHGLIEVTQVANGFVVNIGRKEGYEYETHIASSIKEVNEIIAAQMVAFKLEDKA